MKRLFLLLIVLTLAVPTLVLAEPKAGFGIYAGLSQDSGDQKSSGSSTTYKSSGLAIGGDYQFKVGTSMSLSPFIELTDGEKVTCTGCSGVTADRTAFGGEFRYWFDAIFVGGRLAITSSSFKVSGGGSSSDFQGTGIGIVGGWEGANGLFVKLNYDNMSENAKKNGSSTDDSVSSLKAFVGYRF